MRSIWLYRLLLKLYPAGFRENYAGPLEREFRDERAEAGGAAELARLWVRTAVDLLLSAPPQMIREFGEDARHALRLWRRGRRTLYSRSQPWRRALARAPAS